MPSFSYVAREAGSNRELRGTLDASTEQSAIIALLNRNLLVLSIQEKISKKGKTSGGAVALQDLVVFTRHLATMIDAGRAMVQSLQALAEQTTNKVMKDVIHDVCTRVEGGGLLAEILARLATYLENTARLRRKVKSSCMYPTAVTLVAIGIMIFLLVKVVPVFGDVYKGFGSKLPGPTQFLINLSEFVKAYNLYILGASGGLVYGWFAWIKTKKGREFWDTQRIRLSIFGQIAHKICLARFTRTLTNTIMIHDVIVGEVWIASGQSNMEWPMSRSLDSTNAIAASVHPMIRLFTVPKLKARAPTNDVRSSWQECGPETVPGFSAVAYYFGRDLQKSRQVPVGLIHTS